MRTKVEILHGEARPDLVLEPFFRGAEEARLIKLLQSIPERQKFGVYFDRHGCLKCGRRDRPHASSMMCGSCNSSLRQELAKIKKELEQGKV